MVATSHQRGSFFRASQPCTPHRQPEQYARRHPDQTLFYRLIARHVETWLAERNLGDKPVAAYVEAELRGYLRCGICPSCNGRRMAQTTARLVDHVIPPVPVRQWVVSVPKRLRWFLGERSADVAAITRIFMSEVQRRVRHRRRVYQDRDG